jgi:hypothetical protein
MFSDPRYNETLENILKTEDFKLGNIASSSPFVNLVNDLGDDVTALELGIAFGLNVIFMIEHCSNIKKYYAIDPHLAYQDWGPDVSYGNMQQELMTFVGDKFLENLNAYDKKDKIQHINKTGNEAKDLIPDNSIDFLFIDANHSIASVRQDCLNYYGKMKKSGIFCGHDYDSATVIEGVKQFMEIAGIPEDQLEVLSSEGRHIACWMIRVK